MAEIRRVCRPHCSESSAAAEGCSLPEEIGFVATVKLRILGSPALTHFCRHALNIVCMCMSQRDALWQLFCTQTFLIYFGLNRVCSLSSLIHTYSTLLYRLVPYRPSQFGDLFTEFLQNFPCLPLTCQTLPQDPPAGFGAISTHHFPIYVLYLWHITLCVIFEIWKSLEPRC